MVDSFDGVRVLFVCVANSARSPMAAALAPRILGSGVIATSAGAHAGSSVHPYAVETMNDVGLDIATHVPRALSDVDPSSFDEVVVLCDDADIQDLVAGKPVTRARISDPVMHAMEFSRSMALEGFRCAREDIEDLLAEMAKRGPASL